MTVAAPSRILDTINGHRNPHKDIEAGELEQYDQGMHGDLAYIVEALQWAWAVAWEPLDPGAASASDQDNGEEETETTVVVAGSTYDIGVGNPQAQHALRTAGPALAACDAILDIACQVASRGEGPRQLPIVQQAAGDASLRDLLTITTSINWRLNYLNDRAVTTTEPAIVLKQLRLADKKLRFARGPLEHAMRVDDKNNPTAINPDAVCKNCGIRARLKDRKRCATCHTYKQRNGTERPADLDAA